MKTCTICKVEKHITAFNKKKRSSDGYQNVCRECNQGVSASYYKRHTTMHAEVTGKRSREQRNNNRKLLWKYFESHPCVDCGETDPIVLECDHVDRTQKRANVSTLLSYDWSLVLRELENCVVRCANCHRRKTAIELGYYKYMAP